MRDRTSGYEALAENVKKFSPRRWRRSAAFRRHTIREVARLYATLQGLDDPVGHGHLPARARHRQRALPDRARDGDRPDRPPRHRTASAARPEQRAGRVRLRPDPDVLSGLPARRQSGGERALRETVGRRRSTRSPVSPWSRSCTRPEAHEIRGHVRAWARTRRCPIRMPTMRARRWRARSSRRAGHLPDRDRLPRRRGAAGHRLAGEDRHGHQHRPHGAARPQGDRSARRRARRSAWSSRVARRMGLDWHYQPDRARSVRRDAPVRWTRSRASPGSAWSAIRR